MPEQPGQPFLIATPKQWAAATSPARFEIIEFMASLGPCTVAELAFQLDRPADGLYHHLAKLARAGLVVRQGFRQSGPRPEAVYTVVSVNIRPDFDPVTGKNAGPFRKLCASILRMTNRQINAAIDTRGPLWEPDHAKTPAHQRAAKRLWARSETAWLSDADLAQINQHLFAVQEIVSRSRTKRRGRLFTLTTFLFPLVRSRHSAAPTPNRPIPKRRKKPSLEPAL